MTSRAEEILDRVMPLNGGREQPSEDTGEPVEPAGRSWQPVDLGPILRGEHKPAEPSVGFARSDGLRFLYPGKEHSVIGEMECGKSWFSAACCAAELQAGNHVLYIHFEEADATDTVGRLQALGIPDETILALFHFVGPEEPVQPYMLAMLLDPAPTLAVLDGVNEAMALHGQGIRDEDGAAAFRRRLVKPCTSVGAAVLSADHVVKDREQRGRGPLGSVHKGNGLSGSLILLENNEPFGRGQRGRSSMYVTKDRPGFLRRHGRNTQLPGKTFMGSLVVDDTRERVDYLDLVIWAPTDKPQETPAEGHEMHDIDAKILAVVESLAAKEPVALTTVRAAGPYGNTKTADSLTRLVLAGKVIETSGPNRARLFTASRSDLVEREESSGGGSQSFPSVVPLKGGNDGNDRTTGRSRGSGTTGNDPERPGGHYVEQQPPCTGCGTRMDPAFAADGATTCPVCSAQGAS